MLTIKYTAKMKRDVKRAIKRGKNISKLTIALDLLASERQMPEKYQDHPLKGEMRGYRECHIEPDWLLVYQIDQGNLVLLASGTGTHSDLFEE
ncbi:MAG: type II toxin-antitoxin system YafQ family toxin [Clostridia bacterium]|nr:type II toxin-antitoxin system YafQ family toxin [Clostridia bacterium]